MGKLTKWFPPNIAPVREGVYEVIEGTPSRRERWFAYWDGSRFGWRTLTHPRTEMTVPRAIEQAYTRRTWPTGLPPRASWRGLSTNPMEGKK